METSEQGLLNLDTLIDKSISDTWPLKAEGFTTLDFAAAAETISNAIILTGDESYQQLEHEDAINAETAQLEHYVATYLWPEQAKSFLILWRDILFELLKSRLLLEENKIEAETFEQLLKESEEVLHQAAYALKSFTAEITQSISQSPAGVKKNIEEWLLQTNPWPAYKAQISEIAEQCDYLESKYAILLDVENGAQQIRALVYQTLDSCTAELEAADDKANKTITFITEVLSPGKETKLSRVTTRLEELEEETHMIHHLNAFGYALDKMLQQIPDKMQVPVGVEEGIISYKEINFRKSFQQWMGSEILPLLYEVWEQTELIGNSLKMSLVNIRNRLLLLSSEEKEPVLDVKEISQPLHNFLKKNQNAGDELRKLRLLIKKRMNEVFYVSGIYSKVEEFLPLPLQSTINNFRFNQNKLLQNVYRWVNKLLNSIRQFRTNVVHEEALSISERVVLYIKGRQPDPASSNYTSIFMTKGFIGESFWVGREQELDHVKEIIAHWREGFRGSVAVSGQRFSGKSLYGELVSHRYFTNNTIRILPRQMVDIKGRKMTAEFDLGKVLEFVIKHTINERPMIWLDDLELWNSPDVPLVRNLRALRKAIDDHGSRIFFMVSMSNWLKAHLNKMQNIERMFQSEINMDRMPIQKIREAILIRHGATHKSLTNEEGEQLSPQKFQHIIRHIYKTTEGNIGDSLQLWSANIRQIDDEHVLYEQSAFQQLPDFLNIDTALLLSTIMMEKRTTEYRLRKLLGPAFSEKYSGLLQRLFSVGILTRQLDGWLEVSELVANDLGRKLAMKGYIKFNHS